MTLSPITTTHHHRLSMMQVIATNHRNNARENNDTSDNIGDPDNNKNSDAVLEAALLTAYDLPFPDEAPSHVSIGIGGDNNDMAQESGWSTIIAKQEGRKNNLFYRFSGTTNSSTTTAQDESCDEATTNDAITKNDDVVRISAPLLKLYNSKLQVKVVYSKRPSRTLNGYYDLSHLRIWERKWVILTLSSDSSRSNKASSSSSSSSIITIGGAHADENFAPNTDAPSGEREHASGNDNDDTALPPTFRMALHLGAPYRPEIASIIGFSATWFGMVDGIQDELEGFWGTLPALPFDKMYLALPIVPILAIIVVASPILVGVLLTVGLPLLLPILVAITASLFNVIFGVALVLASSRGGRARIKTLVQPIAESLFHSRSGQSLLYETGPRPTPVRVAKLLLPSGIWSTLVASLAIDLIGSASYLLPLVGEAFDLLWAPLQTILIIALYESEDWAYPSLKYVSFFEEAFPFTDFVPTATIGWSLLYLAPVVFGLDNKVE